MTWTPEEKTTLLIDLGIIKSKVVEMKPSVDKNTKFRLYTTGFFIILIASVGLMSSLYRLKDAAGNEKENNVKRSIKYYKQVHTR